MKICTLVRVLDSERTTMRMKQTIGMDAGASHKNSPQRLAAGYLFREEFFPHARLFGLKFF
jgi:hypothetical protein